jgi:outer membrane receptor protein involved in Fe transport
MKRSLLTVGAFCAAAVLTCAVGPRLLGQTAPTTGATTATSDQTTEEMVKLSPFVVETTEGTGYRAESTLAGTRVRTDLKDVASSISVATADFLRDIGATNNQTLLQYTTNTEVGGIYGNYAGVGNTFVNGASESSNFLKPNTNTRVRGLDSADNTRDYFLTDIPWDAYNVGRVDLQRGPNSILFGIGSPAGIVNSSVNTAEYKNQTKVENRVGSFGTIRDSLDFERVLLADELAIRIAALDDDTKYREEPAFNNDKRLFGALRWDPKVFERWDSTARTTVRANYEHGDVNANRPRILPPEDRITPFFFTGQTDINKSAIDPYYAWAAGVVPYSSSTQYNGESKNYWLVQYQGPGLEQSSNPQFFYDNPQTGSSGTTTPARAATISGWFAVDSNGNRASGIGGIPFGSSVGIAGYNEFASDVNRDNPTEFPGASSGFYKNRQITDPTIFDFYNNLIDGPNKK